MHPSYKQFNYCQFSSPLESTVCDAIEYLYREIFNADLDESRRSKLTNAEDLQVWMAFFEQQPVAFKVG
ncbi:MAG: hypothetical protein IT269_11875 [Saprospiraceae bacterium]|nr:hypothetical protein [Saprospiraceae bacterium]